MSRFTVVAAAAFAIAYCVIADAFVTAAEGRQIALCVGVETYDPSVFAPLRYSEDDAQALAKTLTDLGYDVLLMTPGAENPRHKPNLPQKIIAQLKTRAAGLTKADSLIVTLSGHGVQFKDDPVGPDGIKDSYFCPQDAALDDRSSLVSLREVYKLVAESGAGRKLVIVDACRNEVLSEKAKSRREIELDPAGLTPRAVPEGMLALFSCASQEKSFEDGDLGHGVFTYHILEYLRGEAEPNKYANQQATLDGLVFHAKGLTQSYVQKHLGRAQQPELVGRSTDWSLGKVDVGKVGPVAVIRHTARVGLVAFHGESQIITAHSEKLSSAEKLPPDESGYCGILTAWNLSSLSAIRTTTLPDAARCLTTHGQYILAGINVSPGGAILWNTDSGEQSKTFRACGRSTTGVHISADGARAMLIAHGMVAISEWSIATGAEIRRLDEELFEQNLGLKGNLDQARFRNDGTAMLVNIGVYPSDSYKTVPNIRLCSTNDGREIQRFNSKTYDPLSIDLSGDGKLATAGGTGGGAVWSTATGAEIHAWAAPSRVVRFSPDGKRAAIAYGKWNWDESKQQGEADPAVAAVIVLIDTRDGAELARFTGHEHLINDLTFSPNGRFLASGSEDHTIRLWRLPH